MLNFFQQYFYPSRRIQTTHSDKPGTERYAWFSPGRLRSGRMITQLLQTYHPSVCEAKRTRHGLMRQCYRVTSHSLLTDLPILQVPQRGLHIRGVGVGGHRQQHVSGGGVRRTTLPTLLLRGRKV